MEGLREAMSSLLEEVRELERIEEDAFVEDFDLVHERLDRLLAGPVATVIDNRQALTDAHGLAAHAGVMGPFAAGERYLNRAWSAATDGYVEETRASIRRARPALEEAREELGRLG